LNTLASELTLKGFLVIDPGALNIPQIAQLLRNTKQVIGVHGAGMANILFAPPGCELTEIVAFHGNSRSIAAICTILGHKYSELRTGQGDVNSKPKVDINEILKLFETSNVS
jgi:capsular polysaccharide biosynthesis protein